jgi:hypothetical protein
MTSQTDPADPAATPTSAAATRLLVLPGDGIGPEIVAATIEVLRAADALFGSTSPSNMARSGSSAPVSWLASTPTVVVARPRWDRSIAAVELATALAGDDLDAARLAAAVPCAQTRYSCLFK